MKKIVVLLLIAFLFASCSAYRVPTLMTPQGRKSYIESNKRINKERKAEDRQHRKDRRRIEKLQHS
jgi:uncharacterized protein YxeA